MLGFPGSSAGKESACNEGDLGSTPGLEDPLEKGMAIHSSIRREQLPTPLYGKGGSVLSLICVT